MLKRLLSFSLLLLFIFVSVGCQTEPQNSGTPQNNEEVITYTGLGEITVYLGTNFYPMENVSFTSSTRGDITSLVQYSVDPLSNGGISLTSQGVKILYYDVHYENNELYRVERRVIIAYPPFDDTDSDNLLENGDFSQSIDHWNHVASGNNPSEVLFIIDPDLDRLQVVIHTPSIQLDSPSLYQTIELMQGNTYKITMLVSSTVDSFFTLDVVEYDEFLFPQQTIVSPITVNVHPQTSEMQEVVFEFTPSVSSSQANFRLMFGSNSTDSPEGIIFIDNIKIVLYNDN